MTYDLAIKNCQIVKPSGIFRGEIAVSSGRIVSIGTTLLGSFKDEIDAGGKFVIPGVIDTHVHLGTADQTFAESIRTESAVAAASGITTAIVYRQIPVLNDPNTLLDSYLKPDIRAVEENSLIDMGFHAIIFDEEAIDRIDELVEGFGITSFKFFMGYKGELALPHIYGMNDGSLFRGMERVGKTKGCISLVHAENSEINQRFRNENRHRQDIMAWNDACPPISEEEAIRRAIFLAERAGSPLCIVHVSTEGGATYVAEAKRWNAHLFQETCPHYLLLKKDMKFEPPSVGRVNPPLRGQSDVSALWTLLGKGSIDIIGSDHCPYTLKVKPKDLWNARSGLPSIGLLLPVLLSEGVNKGRITLEDVSRLTSFQPSKLFGLYPQKGTIEVGSDADLVVVDLEKEVRVTHAFLHGISDFSPYEDYVAKGWPIITISRGRVVFRDGQLNDAMRKGVYLRRKRIDFK